MKTEQHFNEALIPHHESETVNADLMIMRRIVLASLEIFYLFLFIIFFIYYLGKLARILLIMNFNRISRSVAMGSSEYCVV